MQHIAIIPDGNRRWAAENKLKSFLGHKKGIEAFKSSIKVCIKKGIKYLSFYTFSLENFRRSPEEKSYLFDLLSYEITNKKNELIEQKIKVSFLGNRDLFPEKIKKSINIIEKETKHFDTLYLNLLFCYGAQQDIVHGIKKICNRVQNKDLSINDIDENLVKKSLWTGNIPDPDLIIRTGKNVRLSNFLLFQAAYSEFFFLNCFWPEVNESIIEDCLDKFNDCKRNFGV